MKSICQHIENTINPFSTDVDSNCLLNIETGRAASEETVAFLLNVQEAGNAHREKFIKEVNERPDRFEEPIKRNNLNTFQNEEVKPKKTGDNKLSELKIGKSLWPPSLHRNRKFDRLECYPKLSHYTRSAIYVPYRWLYRFYTKIDN